MPKFQTCASQSVISGRAAWQVPKFLRDEQFWAIYFALTRSRLPPEAFDTSLQRELEPEPAAEPKVGDGTVQIAQY